MATKNIAEMEAKRRELDREIKAAKRAEAKRRREELLSARQALGVWLAEAVNADTVDAVARLREALDTDQVRAHLAGKVAAESSDTSAHDSDADAAELPDTSSVRREVYGSHDA